MAQRKPAKMKVQSVTPFLWFEKDAIRAAEFYASVFHGSKVVSTNSMGCEFEIAGQRMMALNGGPAYKLTPAFSLYVSVTTQKQVDELWTRLTSGGGREDRCGWLVDKFGVSWQIIPDRLTELLFHKDPKVANAAMEAMLKMQKIEIADLDAAVARLENTRKAAKRRRS